MTVVPGWMWQTMHWLVGMPLPGANRWSIGCPLSFRGIVGSGEKLQPRLP